MKKSIFALFAVLIAFISCRPVEKPVVLVQEVPKILTIDYVTSLLDSPEVKSLKTGEMFVFFVDTEKVATTKIVGYVGRFHKECHYGYLDNLLNKTSISAIWKGLDSQLPIGNKEDLQSYEIYDNFVIQDTGRVWVEISDTLYFKNNKGKWLRTY